MSTLERVWLRAAAIGGLAAALSLLAPWARSGRVDRSMFGLISSARSVDLLSGTQVVIVVSAVMLVLISVSAGLVGVAWDRPRMAALALLVPGPILIFAAVVVSGTSLHLRWGAIGGSAAGAVASTCAMISLVSTGIDEEVTRDRLG